MEGTIDNTKFAFIVYPGAKLPIDSGQRTLIRRRAMRDVAETRKQKAAQSGCNTATILFMSNPFKARTDIRPSNCRRSSKPRLRVLRTEYHETIQQQRSSIRPPFSSLSSNILITEYFSILNLAPLTGLRLGVTTLSFFTKDSSNIIQALSPSIPGSQKLLSLILPRYGQVLSLSLAVDCIVVKLKQMIRNDSSESTSGQIIVLHRHTKALERVQHDLNDRNQWMSSETLCAIQLLGVFDVYLMLQLQLFRAKTHIFIVDQ